MKNLTKLGLLMGMMLTLTACGQAEEATQETEVETETETEADAETETEEIDGSVEEQAEEESEDSESAEEVISEDAADEAGTIDPADYVGYYNNDEDDIMEIVQSEDGSYKITAFLYKLWGSDEEVLSVEGDKLVFDSEDGNGDPMKWAVYPEDGGLTLEAVEADWTYIKTGDKYTGFTLADTSEPLLNGAGEYYTTLALGGDPEDNNNMVLQDYRFEGQTMIITASFGYLAELDSDGTMSDTMYPIETTTEELPLDNATFYTSGGDAGEQTFGSLDEFKDYLDDVKNSGLGLEIKIHDNQVESVGIIS